MTPAALAALRSRISAEPSGLWLDCIVAQFALGWWKDKMDSEDVLFGPEETRTGAPWQPVHFIGRAYRNDLPPTSSDHNACFAALAALEKCVQGLIFVCVDFRRLPRGFLFWLIFEKSTGEPIGYEGRASATEGLPLAAARAIALAAVDNGVEVEHA